MSHFSWALAACFASWTLNVSALKYSASARSASTPFSAIEAGSSDLRKFFSGMALHLQQGIANTWMESDTLGDLLLDQNNASFMQNFALTNADSLDHQQERRRMASDFINGKIDRKQFDSLAEGYARIYKAEFASRDAVFFNHVSKSCGTTLCMCSWDSGCKAWGAANEDDNCHARGAGSPMDIPAWGGSTVRPEAFNTCKKLQTYNEAHSFTVEVNENHLIRQGVCHQFWNMIILRDPVDRLISHLSHLRSLDEKVDRDWAQVPVGEVWDPESVSTETLFSSLPVVANNFYIRNLLGPKGYEIPFGEVTEAHLDEAKKILEEFDLVLVKNAELTSQLERLAGWKCASHIVRPGRTEDYKDALELHWEAGDWNAVRKHNELDTQLFQHASALNKIDMEVFNAPGFNRVTEGESSCPSGSHQEGKCGYLCK